LLTSKLVSIPLTKTSDTVAQEVAFDAGTPERVQKRVLEILQGGEQDADCVAARDAWREALDTVADLEAGAARLNDRLDQLHREAAESVENLNTTILADPDASATREAVLAQRDSRDVHTAIARTYEEALISRIPRARVAALRAEGEYLRVAAVYLQTALERHAERRTQALQAVVEQDGSIVADMAPGSVSAELTRVVLEFRRKRDGTLAQANSEASALQRRIDARAASMA